MEIGIFLMPAHPPERSLYDATQWDLEIIELADELGYVEAWVGEHFTVPWEPICAPDLLLAQALLRTSLTTSSKAFATTSASALRLSSSSQAGANAGATRPAQHRTRQWRDVDKLASEFVRASTCLGASTLAKPAPHSARPLRPGACLLHVQSDGQTKHFCSSACPTARAAARRGTGSRAAATRR